MRDFLSLYINGQPIEVRGEDSFLTLSDFLRKRRRLTGTKVVCAEGDCGSCSVLFGRLINGRIVYRTITSCIVGMYQLDAAHVITVEGLSDGEELNPIQQAMVACHGAQCGFCTPGFVVALTQILNDEPAATRETVCRGLVGNLCRCTGYDAILRAAERAGKEPLVPLAERYPPAGLLPTMRQRAAEDVAITCGNQQFYKATTMAQALAFRSVHPGCAIVSGSTDWGVLLNKRIKQAATVLVLNGVRNEQAVELESASNTLRVGAAAVVADLETAANEHLPELGKFLQYFGSPPIRNGATLAGNVATGSPIGDSLPALHVINAEIELASVRGTRRVNINDFFTGYRANVMTPDEVILALRLPLLREDESLKLYKVSKRKDLDIASFGAAIWLRRAGERISDVRIAMGGVGPTILRMDNVEAHLRGKPMSESLFAEAGQIAARDVTPISDVRGSLDYRRTLAGNILRKAFFDLSEPAAVGGT